MKCEEAREAMNCLIDGDNHPCCKEAADHISACSKCREWHEGIMAAINSISLSEDELAVIDFAPMVMSRLPDRHPAFVRSRKKVSMRVLAWTAVSWVMGALMLVVLSVVLKDWFAGIDVNHTATQGYSAIRTFGSTLEDIARIPMILLRVVQHVINDFGIVNIAISAVIAFLIFDTVILATAVTIWKHKRIPGALTL
ncbi:MAG: hypothetical protein ACYC27_00635 [Armatimonadota bacterium]